MSIPAPAPIPIEQLLDEIVNDKGSSWSGYVLPVTLRKKHAAAVFKTQEWIKLTYLYLKHRNALVGPFTYLPKHTGQLSIRQHGAKNTSIVRNATFTAGNKYVYYVGYSAGPVLTAHKDRFEIDPRNREIAQALVTTPRSSSELAVGKVYYMLVDENSLMGPVCVYDNIDNDGKKYRVSCVDIKNSGMIQATVTEDELSDWVVYDQDPLSTVRANAKTVEAQKPLFENFVNKYLSSIVTTWATLVQDTNQTTWLRRTALADVPKGLSGRSLFYDTTVLNTLADGGAKMALNLRVLVEPDLIDKVREVLRVYLVDNVILVPKTGNLLGDLAQTGTAASPPPPVKTWLLTSIEEEQKIAAAAGFVADYVPRLGIQKLDDIFAMPKRKHQFMSSWCNFTIVNANAPPPRTAPTAPSVPAAPASTETTSMPAMLMTEAQTTLAPLPPTPDDVLAPPQEEMMDYSLFAGITSPGDEALPRRTPDSFSTTSYEPYEPKLDRWPNKPPVQPTGAAVVSSTSLLPTAPPEDTVARGAPGHRMNRRVRFNQAPPAVFTYPVVSSVSPTAPPQSSTTPPAPPIPPSAPPTTPTAPPTTPTAPPTTPTAPPTTPTAPPTTPTAPPTTPTAPLVARFARTTALSAAPTAPPAVPTAPPTTRFAPTAPPPVARFALTAPPMSPSTPSTPTAPTAPPVIVLPVASQMARPQFPNFRPTLRRDRPRKPTQGNERTSFLSDSVWNSHQLLPESHGQPLPATDVDAALTHQSQPVVALAHQTPVVAPAHQTPVVALAHLTQVAAPPRQTPVVVQAHQTPVAAMPHVPVVGVDLRAPPGFRFPQAPVVVPDQKRGVAPAHQAPVVGVDLRAPPGFRFPQAPVAGVVNLRAPPGFKPPPPPVVQHKALKKAPVVVKKNKAPPRRSQTARPAAAKRPAPKRVAKTHHVVVAKAAAKKRPLAVRKRATQRAQKKAQKKAK